MLPQPIATIVNGDRTDPVYSRGSRKLAIGAKMDNRPHDSVDNRHVNESSGALWLRIFSTSWRLRLIAAGPWSRLPGDGAGSDRESRQFGEPPERRRTGRPDRLIKVSVRSPSSGVRAADA